MSPTISNKTSENSAARIRLGVLMATVVVAIGRRNGSLNTFARYRRDAPGWGFLVSPGAALIQREAVRWTEATR